MKKCCFGVDVGGTSVKLGFFGTDGQLVKKWEIPTRTEENGRYVVPDICDALKKEMEAQGLTPEELAGVGMGLPGPVTEDGTVLGCVNLGWGERAIEKEMSEAFFGLPVKAANDANAAAMGEYAYGGGRGFSSMMMVTLGTGVGGGLVIGGNLMTGFRGAAGEIGHMNVYPHAKKNCNCGGRGCLEQIGGARGMVIRAHELIEDTELPSALRDREDITAKDILDLHGQDPLADEIIDEMTAAVSKGMALISCVVDPEVYVVGGGVSRAGQWLMDRLQERFLEQAFHACRKTRVVPAELGNDAGIYGAAALVYAADK